MNKFIRRFAIHLYERQNDRHILTRLNELNKSQWFSQAELDTLQREKLQRILSYANHYLPYYHRLFVKHNFQPDRILTDITALQRLPILTKATLRQNFEDLITLDSKNRHKLIQDNTVSTTAPLIFGVDTNFRDHFTADVHRHLMWGGWQFGQPHAFISRADYEIEAAASLRSRLMNWGLNRFSLNANPLGEALLAEFITEIKRRQSRLLYGYASSLYTLAQYVQANDIKDVQFDSIFSSAEVLYPQQRELIEEIFACPVYNHYNTREVGELACECDVHDGLHISSENVFIEIVNDDGELCQPGEPGQIVATNLNNFGMPFIRYALGDVAAWHPDDAPCSCGRHQPKILNPEGRQTDRFKKRDGSTVLNGFSSPLWEMDDVHQFQYVQKDYDLVTVRIVKEGELQVQQKAQIQEAVQCKLGDDVTVQFEFPEEIPVESSGKYRYQICEIEH